MTPIDRREFVRHAVGTTAVGATLLQTALADSKLEDGWIDAHVHIWTPETDKYPLDRKFDVSDMQPPSFTTSELLDHCRPAGVQRIVLIQMSFYGLDHRYMLEAMQQNPGVFSAVALIDFHANDVVDTAIQLVSKGVRGFRLHSQGDAKEWCVSPTMHQLWMAAAEHQFAICPLINPQDIEYVDLLCQKFPETTVVVDHFARIGVSGTIEENRLDELCRLARFPNTHVKASAYYALGQKKAPYHDLLPMLRKVIDAFGPQRVMWATDCPYQVQGDNSYQASIDLILQESNFLSSQDKNWILRDTAAKVFFC